MKDLDQLLIETGEKFGQIIGQASFDFWQDQTFRNLVNFDNLSQTEQDRIFNELEVSALGLFSLNLDQAIKSAKSNEQEMFYIKLKPALIEGFLSLFKKLGVEKQYINEWRLLIDMRLEEYRKDFEISLKESKKLKEAKDNSELQVLWAKIETISIDCLTHIRRGDVKEKDPLWRMLRRWLTGLEVTFDKLTLQLPMQPAAVS